MRSPLSLRELVRIAWDVRRAPRRGETAIAARGRGRLAALVEFARARSPFYAARYSRLPPGPVDGPSLLPPVAKRDLEERFDDWPTDRAVTRRGALAFAARAATSGELYLGRYAVWTTSGTTGAPSLFVTDRHALAVYAALSAARQIPLRVSPRTALAIARGGRRVATVVTTGGPYASAVVAALFARHYPGLSGNSRLFSIMEPLPELVRALSDFRPAVLGGYPTALAVLAREQEAGRLDIRPALAMTGAEWLSPASRARIENAFGCAVVDTYAASEFMGIAFDCPRGRFHVNADWVLLEPVDRAFCPVPPGTPSHTVLLTNLANRVLPLIRYDLGDCVTALPGRCPCGSPFPAVAVEGRRNAVFRFRRSPGAEGAPVLPMALATVIEEVPGVRAYQVLQEGAGAMWLRLEAAEGVDAGALGARLLADLRAWLSRQGLSWVEVRLSPDPPARDPRGGKLPQFIAADE